MGESGHAGGGPLGGVRVLELGSFIAGPFAGQLLGDYGAEVIKIEPPGGGDPMRRWGITRDGKSLWWPAIARNKRSVAIDMRAAQGRDLVRRIAAHCDIVLENFRPGRLDEWDLGYSTLSAANPGVILVHVSGYGQTGPRAQDAGFGSIGEAMGGIRFTTGSPDRPPSRAGISLGDSLAAMFSVIGSLAALAERSRTGRGQEVDVAIYEAVAALMESTLADFEIGGVLRSRSGSVLAGVAPSNVYTSADGVDIVLAANADSVFRRLCAAMGQPELADDPRYRTHHGRGDNMAELDRAIGAWSATRDAEGLLADLAAHGVPAGKIYTAADMLTDVHYVARDMIIRLGGDAGAGAGATGGAGGPGGASQADDPGLGGAPMLGIVPKFSRTPGGVTAPGRPLGADTRQVLTDLAGVDDEEWTRLLAAGLVAESDLPRTGTISRSVLGVIGRSSSG